MSKESIILDGGKYEVILDQTDGKFKFYALRFDEEWREFTGDKLALCMFQRIRDLEDKLYISIK